MPPPGRSTSPAPAPATGVAALSPLERRVADTLRRLCPEPEPLLLAVSGGLDSMVLLELLQRTQSLHGHPLLVAHFDHEIHPESGAVAAAVRRRAVRGGLEFCGGSGALGPQASETRARTARLRWLRAEAHRRGIRWIVTAHQRDDQLETILMRALRGSGPVGLSGMAARERGVLRPLLGLSRRSLRRYADRRGLEWWEDPANRDTRHLRSWIRHALLPVVAQRLPDHPQRLARLASQARADRQGWRAALRHWPGLGWRREAGRESVRWAALLGLPGALAVQLAAALVRDAGGPAGPGRVRRALLSMREAGSGARADLGAGWGFELGFDRLYVLPPSATVAAASLVLLGPTGELAWGHWRVRWSEDAAPQAASRDGFTAWFRREALTLGPWRPGVRLAPLGGRGRRLAVRLFQEARIPRSERLEWPLLYDETGVPVWIPGICRSQHRVPDSGGPALRVDVDRSC